MLGAQPLGYQVGERETDERGAAEQPRRRPVGQQDVHVTTDDQHRVANRVEHESEVDGTFDCASECIDREWAETLLDGDVPLSHRPCLWTTARLTCGDCVWRSVRGRATAR